MSSYFIIDNPSGQGKLKITIEPYIEEIALKKSNKLYIFNWPSYLGGADTRIAHTIKILSKFMDITVIPNSPQLLQQKHWTSFLDGYGCKYTTMEKLGDSLDGYALSMCNDFFFKNDIAKKAKEKGLKIVWSSEMMWHHQGELDAIKEGIVDTVLYTSETQKSALKANYDKNKTKELKEFVIDNFIDHYDFPLIERNNKTENITIGRVSRSDPLKYPENFPLFYTNLNLKNPKYAVMGWDKNLEDKFRWFNFDGNWKLYTSASKKVINLLEEIDIFVYPLGHRFRESWGRSTAEAMLSGCPVVVPSGDHHFINFIQHGKTGFIYKTYEECRQICQFLEQNPNTRKEVGIAARDYLIQNVFNIEEHTKKWKEVFDA